MKNWTDAIDAGKPFEMEFIRKDGSRKFRILLTRGNR